MIAIGDSSISPKRTVITCLLVVWLGRGSRAAWWLFMAVNGLTLLASLAIAASSTSGGSGAGTDWGNVVALTVGPAALLAILLSPTMRRPSPPSRSPMPAPSDP